jgi:glutathione S-transferase
MTYELFYHASNPGRGEFIRIPLEDAQAAYVDVAREPDGLAKMTRFMQDAAITHPQFAPPFLKHGDLVIGQTANILLYLGPRLDLAPASEGERLWAHQVQLTISDLVQEIQHTHHPVAHGLYFDDQKAEAITCSRHFLAERLPKFLGWFTRVLGPRSWMIGDACSYVDLSIFALFEGLRFSFPKAMVRLEPQFAPLVALRDRVAMRPNVAAYMRSPRRLSFNERGVFRQYPELDG